MATAARQFHQTTAQPLPAGRYRLPDIVLVGRPISTNRYKEKFRIPGSHQVMSKYTPEAEAWMQQATRLAQAAAAARGKGVPHPMLWPRPLRFSVYVRDGRIDLDNSLKVPVDGIRDGLGVDDRNYEYGCIVREAHGRNVPRGLRIVVESAPIPAPSAASDIPVETTKPAPSARATRRRSRLSPVSTTQRSAPSATRRAPRASRTRQEEGAAM